ncbi:hypothetical protein [Flagellimonas marinaquae]|uniref:hypothetical protein n=1 Tax=Flagellimonas marinaquae TaxID=254955 RepID=UPI000F8F1CD9|nr:hypothetical protein [Allomuricauda aquimarina]
MTQISNLSARSFWLSSLFFGESFMDIITPWRIRIDTESQIIEVSKRNKYLIGVDREIIPFKNIRNIHLDAHLIGADLYFKVYGGNVIAKCLFKSQAKRLYNFGIAEIANKDARKIKFM